MDNIETKIMQELKGIIVKSNEPLCKYTNTRTGGPADFAVFPTSIEEARNTVLFTKENGLDLTVIGNASNLIVKDGGISGGSYSEWYQNIMDSAEKKPVETEEAAQ